jgi:hypothetical protein
VSPAYQSSTKGLLTVVSGLFNRQVMDGVLRQDMSGAIVIDALRHGVVQASSDQAGGIDLPRRPRQSMRQS